MGEREKCEGTNVNLWGFETDPLILDFFYKCEKNLGFSLEILLMIENMFMFYKK